MNWTWFHRLGSPPHFFRIAGKMVPWLAWLAAIAGAAGLVGALGTAPPDYQQGEGYRIIFVHVPSAVLSTLAYAVMAAAAAVGLVWRMNVAHAIAASSAAVGAWFTFVALATGSLWGRPMWGTYWEWDPRLTSELVLLFLYLGYMGLRSAIDDTARADRASAVLALVGVINLPIIHYSVDWWNSLHQGHTLLKFGKAWMPPSMLVPLLLMMLAFMLYFAAVLLVRARGEVLRRERNARWVIEAIGAR